MGVDSNKVSIAPCGVDLELFGRKGESEPRRRRHRLVSVGRLVPRKGVDLVIRSLAALKRDGHDDVELVIVGGGGDSSALASDPEAQRLLALAGELGVQDQVDMRGQVPREDIPALLRSADAVVCTPWYEPFGIVPLEAMACGAPVVAASVGGLIDTVQDRTTGLQVRPKDSQALATALSELLQNPEMGRTMGQNGQRRVHSRYSWSRVAADTEKAYQAALRSKVSEPSSRRQRRLQSTGGSVL
jgi:D-inositol-3-phosphate glycosyltransferase